MLKNVNMPQSVAVISTKFKRLTIAWLVMAGAMFVVWLIMWLASSAPKAIQKHEVKEITTQDFALPARIETLGELDKEVKPVDFEMVIRDLRNYPKEFKDKKFFEEHKERWTVQVMDVAQNDIITAYLDGRNDRGKFAYFRYNQGNEIRYILTYDIVDSREEALGAIKAIEFGLPKSIRVSAQPVGDYLSKIANYERGEPIVDMAESTPRNIKLQETKREIPATPAEETKPKASTPPSAEDVAAELDALQQLGSGSRDRLSDRIAESTQNRGNVTRQPNTDTAQTPARPQSQNNDVVEYGNMSNNTTQSTNSTSNDTGVVEYVARPENERSGRQIRVVKPKTNNDGGESEVRQPATDALAIPGSQE